MQKHLASKAANIFILFVLLLGFISFLYWYFIKNHLENAILNTLSLLIVACPCALSLSIPTAIVVGIQKLFSYGCLFKNSTMIEKLAKTKIIAFDKTGTLTYGKLEIEKIYSYIPIKEFKLLLQKINQIQREIQIQHPITKALLQFEYEFLTNRIHICKTKENQINQLGNIDLIDKESIQYIPGMGLKFKFDNHKEIFLGSKELLELEDPESVLEKGNIIVYLGIKYQNKKQIIAIFLLRDKIREDAYKTINLLNKKYKTILLTGDCLENALWIQEKLNIQDIHYSLKPIEKAEIIKNLQKNGITIMVGDGINDTIALHQADVGISFADASKLAMYSSDILLLNSNVEIILFLLEYSKNILKKIKQNLTISFVYNICLLPLAFIGFINPFIGSVFMSLSSITVVLNSLTLLKYHK
ncbi:MAG: hypothetical protein KatS3mg129_2669 [Leptospiraceae bacterium]|nr:MAG: hypothetical protein KatS3mg129_2669 [Leptospiraceae bacterium]